MTTVPPVMAGQVWEDRDTLQQVTVLFRAERPWRPVPKGVAPIYWRCRRVRGVVIRQDRFDGKRFRFVSGPTTLPEGDPE